MLFLLASATTYGMLCGGIALMTWMLFRRSSRFRTRQKRQVETRNEHRAASPNSLPLVDAPPEVLRWQVEMHELARDLKGEIDSKLMAMQSLAALAAEQAARLEAAIAKAEQLGVTSASSPYSETAADHFDERHDHASSTDPEWQRLQELKRTAYELADAGQSAASIANRLQANLGDIEMLLSLRTSADGFSN